MPKDNFSEQDVANMRREALIKAGAIQAPEGYHMMATGRLMKDSDMIQDLNALRNAGDAPVELNPDYNQDLGGKV